ncbi:MAG: hypothetical protein WDO06_08775 [Actinomycetota bacterium]
MFAQFRTGEIKCLVVSKSQTSLLIFPMQLLLFKFLVHLVLDKKEAQRLGRILRPKSDGRTARFYSVVSRDTIDQDFAQNRQRFLAELGYSYRIIDADDVAQGKI